MSHPITSTAPATQTLTRQALPWVALVMAMALWGASFVGLKYGFAYYDPNVVLFGRFVVAALVFLPFLPRMRGNDTRKGDWKLMLLMTLCEPGLYFIFESRALQYTTASQAGMVTALQPLMMAGAAAVVFKERLTPRMLVGIFVAFSGVGILTLTATTSESAPRPLLGNVLELLAMCTTVVYTLSMKHLLERYKPLMLTSLQAFGGVLFFLPFLFLPSTELPSAVHPEGIWAIVFLGAGATFGAFFCFSFGLRHVQTAKATNMINLIPAFTLFFGWMLLDETLGRWQLLGVGVIFVGLYLSQGRGSRRALQEKAKKRLPRRKEANGSL